MLLNDNVLLNQQLPFDDIKPHLLGHWGTCPCLTLIYVHLNRFIRNTGLDTLFVVGLGNKSQVLKRLDHIHMSMCRSWHTSHCQVLSCLWLEKSLCTFLPQYSHDHRGLHKLIADFSIPGGFPRFVVDICSIFFGINKP